MSKRKSRPRKLKRERGALLPQPQKSKSQPSVVDQFQAAMKVEESHEASEDRRAFVVNVILSKIARIFPPPPQGLSIISVDISFDTVLDKHDCVRCASKTRDIGHIRINDDTVCIYPICARCGKMSSTPGPVSEEVEKIVYATLGIDK